MYLKRFYLYNSCINYPPMRIMLTCVYLAGKVRAPGAGGERRIQVGEADACSKAGKGVSGRWPQA